MLYQSKTYRHSCFAEQSPKHHLLLKQPILGISLCIGTCSSIFSCPGAKPSGKHLGRAAHPLACKLCTWGKMPRKKEKKKNLGISTGCKSCCLKQSQRMSWSNEAQSRQPVLGLPQSPHPPAQILAAQSSEAAPAGHPRQKNLGDLLLLFPVVPFPVTLCILPFLSLVVGCQEVSGGQRAQFSCAGAALMKPLTNAPLCAMVKQTAGK